MLENLIEVLVPILVQEGEALLGTKPGSHDWVVGLVDEIASLLDSKLPAWFRPSEDEVKQLVEAAIEKLLPAK